MLIPSSAFAADVVYKEAKVTEATNKDNTGFATSVPGGSSISLKDGFLIISNPESATSRTKTLACLNSWNGISDSFVAEVNILLTELSGTKRIYFDPAPGKEYEIKIEGDKLYVGGVDSGVTLSKKQYIIHIIVDKNAENNIEVLLDYKKVGGFKISEDKYIANFEKLLQNKDGKNELNIDVYGKSSQLGIGDTKIFVPGSVSANIEQKELETATAPIKVTFERPASTKPTELNVKLVDDSGKETAVVSVTPEVDENGNYTGFVAIPEVGMDKTKTHHIELNEIYDIFGAVISPKTNTFTITPDDFDCSIKEVKLSGGIGDTKKGETVLGKGFAALDITIGNQGKKQGTATVAAEFYTSADKLIYSGAVKKRINAFSEAGVSIGAELKENASYAKVRILDNYKDKNDLAEPLVLRSFVAADTEEEKASGKLSMEYDFDKMELLISGNAASGERVALVMVNKDDEKLYYAAASDAKSGKFEVIIPIEKLSDGEYYAIAYTKDKILANTKYFEKSLIPEKDKGSSSGSGSGSGGGGGGGGGGSYSGGSSSAVVFAPVVEKPVQEEYVKPPLESFTDVPEGHWAHDAIISLAKDGIISGIGDGLFGTDMHITREQFAKLLIDTMKLDLVEDDIEHTDVDKNSWSYPYLVAIYKYGIMSGYSDTELGVKDNIKRQDLAVLIKEALVVKGIELSGAEKAPVSDSESISEYAKESVNYLYNAGIISGMEDGSFMPQDFVTRAQAAVILSKLRTMMGGMGV